MNTITKKELILSLIALFVLSINISAINILEENKIWVLAYTDPNIDGEFSQFICGDTIIENITYHKSYWNTASEDHYYGGLREENNQIYYRSFDENIPELLLYDFNLNTNDTFNVYVGQSSTPIISKVVVSKTTEVAFGEEREIYYFDDGDKWIEGIGSIYGLIYHNAYNTLLKGFIKDQIIIYCDPPFFENDCEDFLSMHNCNLLSKASEIEYGKLRLFPNPSSNRLNVDLRIPQNLEIGKYLIIYDVRGIEVYSKELLEKDLNTIDISNLPKGLYYLSIQGGNSITAKFVKK